MQRRTKIVATIGPASDDEATLRELMAAGMDVVLHCNGDLAERRSILGAIPLLSGVAAERWARAEAMRHAPEAADIAVLTNQLAELLGTAQT